MVKTRSKEICISKTDIAIYYNYDTNQLVRYGHMDENTKYYDIEAENDVNYCTAYIVGVTRDSIRVLYQEQYDPVLRKYERIPPWGPVIYNFINHAVIPNVADDIISAVYIELGERDNTKLGGQNYYVGPVIMKV